MGLQFKFPSTEKILEGLVDDPKQISDFIDEGNCFLN